MKRDLDLIRHLLIYAEKHDGPFDSESIAITGYSKKEITYNVGLLSEVKYLQVAALHAGMEGDTVYLIKGLSFAGHDYLDAVRQSKIWERVKQEALKSGITLTVEMAKQLAISLTHKLLTQQLLTL